MNREYPRGFSEVAAFIAKDTDSTTTIYRGFNRLSAKNLLYLQSRLQKLEAIDEAIDKEDLLNPTPDAVKGASSREDLERLALTDARERKRLDLAEQIEVAIKAYQKALLLQSKVLALSRPAKRTLNAYKKWFNPKSGPDSSIIKLRGHSARILDNEDDLVALRVPAAQDRFTGFVISYLPWLFMPDVLGEDVAYISEKRVARFVAIFSTALAAFLLIGAIATLRYNQARDWQVGIIALFTATFAGSVSLFTSAGRTGVFAATAAYAAVLVVFVSGNSTGL